MATLSDRSKILYLIRGISGCGKSTLSQELRLLYTSMGKSVEWVEADKFLYSNSGEYVWSEGRVIEAHRQAYLQARKAFEEGVDVIIVSNQSVREKDMQDFIAFSKEFDYTVVRFVVENMHGGLNSSHGISEQKAREAARVIRANIRLMPEKL